MINGELVTSWHYSTIQTVDAFIAWYAKCKQRNLHEFMRPGFPCRLFMDIDDPKNSRFFDLFVTELERVTKELLLEDFNISDPSIQYWSAHREGKKSLHVIYENVVFDDFGEMQFWMDKVIKKLGENYRMDDRVYGTTPRRLRMPYSTTVGLCNPLVPVTRGMTWNESLKRSLVTCIPDGAHHISLNVSYPSHLEIEGDANSAAVNRIREWVQRFYSVKKMCRTKVLDTNFYVIAINPPLFCPVKNGFHAKQSTFMFIRLTDMNTAEMYFQCADSTCSHVRIPYKGNISDVAFPNIT